MADKPRNAEEEAIKKLQNLGERDFAEIMKAAPPIEDAETVSEPRGEEPDTWHSDSEPIVEVGEDFSGSETKELLVRIMVSVEDIRSIMQNWTG